MNKKLLMIPLIILFLLLLKPVGFTVYCNTYTPSNAIDTDDFFKTCLYNSTMNYSDESLFNTIDKLPIRTDTTLDFLFYSSVEKQKIDTARKYLEIGIQMDYNNGTFKYFGMESELYSKLEEKNKSKQNDIERYRKHSKNKNLTEVINLYENWLNIACKNEKFYQESLAFINQYKK